MFDIDALRTAWRAMNKLKTGPAIHCENCATFRQHAHLSGEDVERAEAELRRILLEAESQGRRRGEDV